eukprot:1442428-Rhodomonas_salina.2
MSGISLRALVLACALSIPLSVLSYAYCMPCPVLTEHMVCYQIGVDPVTFQSSSSGKRMTVPVVYGQSALGEASYYSVTVQVQFCPTRADERSELMCVAGASSGIVLRACYAIPGTDIWYGNVLLVSAYPRATRCPLLTYAMLLGTLMLFMSTSDQVRYPLRYRSTLSPYAINPSCSPAFSAYATSLRYQPTLLAYATSLQTWYGIPGTDIVYDTSSFRLASSR